MIAHNVRDPRLLDIVDKDAPIEQLATGFIFTEGPVWHPKERHLIFSDMPGDHMRKWTPDGKVTTFRKPCNKGNGNVYDQQGRLVTCEHSASRVSRTEFDGSITVLATHWGGKELNSPNDIIQAKDGSFIFTDPSYGRMEGYGLLREPELDFRGVYRLVPDGDGYRIQLLAGDFGQPNGLCLTRDEKGLLVNDTERGHIRYFDVNADGSLSNSRVWAEVTGDGVGAADGMKFDTSGNLYCTGPGGLQVFDGEGTLLGTILVPENTANFNWGDDDLKSIFLTASTSLYRVRVKIPGLKPF
jgi:gluconolactonase